MSRRERPAPRRRLARMKPTAVASIAVLFATFVSPPAPRAEEGGTREPTAQERTLVAEAFALHAALADQVWPGWADTPMAIVLVADDVEMGFGLGRTPEGAVAAAPLGGRDVWVRTRTLAPNLAASFPFEGVPAAVLGLPEATGVSPTQWLVTALHEMFHVLQMSRGSWAKIAALGIGPEDDSSWQLTYPFPYDDDAVMASIHTLGYCLYLAMTAESDDDAAYAAGTAKDALAALEALLRHSTGDEKAFRYARFQMHNEGVALWTEREIARRAKEGGHDLSEEFLALPGAVPFADIWADRCEGTPYLVKHAGRAARSRTAFYHLGFGLASVLDRLGTAWQETHFDPEVWADGLLAEAVVLASRP